MPDDNNIRSALLGIALGDALGLPYEGLNPKKIARRLGDATLKPALLPGLMMVSDDTDHACMALGAWRDCDGDPKRFSKILGRRFKWWFAILPPGVGLATAKAAIKLWFGWNPENSGIRSAGNGPLMRAGILGVVLKDNPDLRREIVDRSTRLTHTDERALDCAHVFAEACAELATTSRPKSPGTFCRRLADTTTTTLVREMLTALAGFPESRLPLAEYLHHRVFNRPANSPPIGVTGYAPESLAGALAAFLFSGSDGLAVIRTAVRFGGDTDSVASFAGCLAGAANSAAFDTVDSHRLRSSLMDIPWNDTSLQNMARGESPTFVRMALRPLRNLAQLLIVIGHGLWRLIRP